ncbi:DUF5988 family protein [Kitasatospora camelliae]|uniref:DUF5988 family protein n=1 Tax=Kitasatospora camelliae TaxID=3156397 RepID=A0AAU8JW00_9ACTN
MPQSQPNVILRGGSVQLVPDEQRTRHVCDPSQPLKLAVANRYEHFEPTKDTVSRGGLELKVMEWVGRTYVAE